MLQLQRKVMRKNQKRKSLFYLFAGAILLMPSIAAAQSSSNSYRVEESYFGTGGNVDSSSTNYRSQQSGGVLGTGTSNSNGFDANAGFNTPSEPFLEAAVTGAAVDFGTLSSSSPSYASAQGGDCNCSFYVRTYLSSEYAVFTASSPPTSENGDVMDAKGTQGTPSIDSAIEEFGINLVANTSPASFGASPVNEPDNTFADGKAANGYQTPNQFKYAVNDMIARSPATSGNPGIGKTDYTISYIMKSAYLTPAGLFKMDQMLIVVPSF
jgi:hypothetical protein